MVRDLLQLRGLTLAAAQTSEPGGLARVGGNGAELERLVNDRLSEVREGRRALAADRWPGSRIAESLDRAYRTDEPEYLDDEDVSATRKQSIVGHLHRMNLLLGAYSRFLGVLTPWIRQAAARHGRRARVLELASGSGGFAIELAARASRQGLPVDIVGSDYLPAHVEAATSRALERGVPVEFRVVNAFEMDGIGVGEYDVVFIAQTMHHFSGGQLARMISQAHGVATSAFVGIDGKRALDVFAFVSAIGPLLGRDFLHDAQVSARKMWSEPELELIARLAAPEVSVRTRSLLPGYSVLEVASAGRSND